EDPQVRYSIAAVLFAVGLGSPAIAIDLDIGVGAEVGEKSGESPDAGWTVRVCRPDTEADEVKIEVGAPGAKDRQTLATWSRSAASDERDVQVYEVPGNLADRGKIWVRGTAKPKDHEATLAVFHGDEAKKVFRFEGREAHDVGTGDAAAKFRCPAS
ncbi:MAG: hypothetical protein ACREQY_06900, partial [Candidatus Binatia bacterium]